MSTTPSHAAGARLLEPLYEQDKLWKDLVTVLRRQRTVADRDRAVELLSRIATIEEASSRVRRTAFDVWLEVLRSTRRTSALASSSHGLAQQLQRWPEGPQRSKRLRPRRRGLCRHARSAARRARRVLRPAARRLRAWIASYRRWSRGRSVESDDDPAPRPRRSRPLRGRPGLARAARRDAQAKRSGPRIPVTARVAARVAALEEEKLDNRTAAIVDVAGRAVRSADRCRRAERTRAPVPGQRAVARAGRFPPPQARPRPRPRGEALPRPDHRDPPR